MDQSTLHAINLVFSQSEMHKVIVLSKDKLISNCSTFNRQIITNSEGRLKDQRTPGSGSLADKKCEDHLLQQESLFNQFKEKINIEAINGEIRLFHLLQCKEQLESFDAKPKPGYLKSNGQIFSKQINSLGVLHVQQKEAIRSITEKINEAKEFIEKVDIVKDDTHNQNSIYHFFIYLSHSMMAQELFELFYRHLGIFVVCLKSVILKESLCLRPEQVSSRIYQYQSLLKDKTEFNQSNSTCRVGNTELQRTHQWIELPKCPECLLRVEPEVSGFEQEVLKTIVTHKFSKSSPCLTCEILKKKHSKQQQKDKKLQVEIQGSPTVSAAHCDDCKDDSDVWICMICCRVGCGRYKNADAYKHFVESGHMLTINLQSEGVWNYLSDCFSHKLMSESDGYMQRQTIEKNHKLKFHDALGTNLEAVAESNFQSAFWQYCSVFSEQMERQRVFYEELKRNESKKFDIELESLEKRISDLSRQREQKQINQRRLIKHFVKAEKKYHAAVQKVNYERQTLREYDQCLERSSESKTQKLLMEDEELASKQKLLADLQEQISSVLIELSEQT